MSSILSCNNRAYQVLISQLPAKGTLYLTTRPDWTESCAFLFKHDDGRYQAAKLYGFIGDLEEGAALEFPYTPVTTLYAMSADEEPSVSFIMEGDQVKCMLNGAVQAQAPVKKITGTEIIWQRLEELVNFPGLAAESWTIPVVVDDTVPVKPVNKKTEKKETVKMTAKTTAEETTATVNAEVTAPVTTAEAPAEETAAERKARARRSSEEVQKAKEADAVKFLSEKGYTITNPPADPANNLAKAVAALEGLRQCGGSLKQALSALEDELNTLKKELAAANDKPAVAADPLESLSAQEKAVVLAMRAAKG